MSSSQNETSSAASSVDFPLLLLGGCRSPKINYVPDGQIWNYKGTNISRCIQLSHFFDNFQSYDWVWITSIVLALPTAEFTWLIRETRSIEGMPGPAVK